MRDLSKYLGAIALLALAGGAMAAGGDLGQVEKQATNWTAIIMFGAFVAGMVLNESEYGHQALSDIIPLRDVFGLLFFASVGMLIDPAFLLGHFGTILRCVGGRAGAAVLSAHEAAF